MKNKIIESAGWLGISIILISYALATFSFIEFKSISYHALNLAGAAGVIASSSYKKDYPPVILNIILSVIALGGLFNLIWR